MNGPNLDETDVVALLTRTADTVDAGAPPTDLVVRGRRAARNRRRSLVAGGVAAAVAVGAGGLALARAGETPADPDRLVAQTPDDPDAAPGMQRIGIGNLSVEIPGGWPRFAMGCAPPQDVGGVWSMEGDQNPLLCVSPFPDDYVSVSFGIDPLGIVMHRQGQEHRLADGTEVFLSDERCAPEPFTATEVCSRSIHTGTGERGVWVLVASSAGRTRIDEVLDTARVTDAVGVPERWQSREDRRYAQMISDVELDDADVYVDLLEEWGLEPEVVEVADKGVDEPRVTSIEPPPGTLVEPATRIRVEVAGR